MSERSTPLSSRERDDEVLDALAVWIRRHLGIVYSLHQPLQYAERLRRYTSEHGLTLQELLVALERGDPQRTRELAEVMSTNYTFFMRENQAFVLLRERVLPQLPEGQNRIWSAATSSGDEAYTMAIHCLEHFGLQAKTRVKILGTDISQRQIERAEAALYSAEHLKLVDDARKSRWFVADRSEHLRVAQAVRELCTFRRMNLTQFPWPFEQRFTIILLRNVLYYMEPAMCERVIEACYDAAAPRAWLVTSITEPLLDLTTRWERLAPGVFHKG